MIKTYTAADVLRDRTSPSAIATHKRVSDTLQKLYDAAMEPMLHRAPVFTWDIGSTDFWGS